MIFAAKLMVNWEAIERAIIFGGIRDLAGVMAISSMPTMELLLMVPVIFFISSLRVNALPTNNIANRLGSDLDDLYLINQLQTEKESLTKQL
jgi:hypothetical protein